MPENVINKSMLNADATRRRAQKIEGVRRVPQGFFDDFSTTAPRQPTHPSRNPISWAQNFVSGMLRKRDRSGIRLPRVVEVPLTAGKPSHVDAEELPRKKEALREIFSTYQTSYHAATKRHGDSKQYVIITAITCYCCHDIHDVSWCYWYCRGSRYKS
ncbi:uncharacterized protein F5891DRAFT_988530 [Suillus fuscotomentosus]|uniref:Uncharacterized protein n=1 Tax=Suillus fuscotomentosus TaxID=1912939 RepID=A0AAD4DP25_9AGAM|nr:uncharacterized protein F5891DRAFT_988530 [Suillus fuscotomentosus]KAG1886931.1 hypothetical protein F5891DRAFT_988530 [Suillus fuscotomentosus]